MNGKANLEDLHLQKDNTEVDHKWKACLIAEYI